MGLWKEIKENENTFIIFTMINIISLLILLWVFTQSQDEGPANLFLIIGIIGYFMILIEYFGNSNKVIDAGVFGQPKDLLISAITATFFATIMLYASQTFGIISFIGTPQAITNQDYYNFLYVVWSASWFETIFFTMWLTPTFAQWSARFLKGNDLPGIIAGGLAAGIFHWTAYGQNILLIVGAVIFFTIIYVHGKIFKSFSGSFVWHFIQNFVAVGRIFA